MRILIISVLLILGACSEKEHSAIEAKDSKSTISDAQHIVATSVISASEVIAASNVTSSSTVVETISQKNKYVIGVSSLGVSFTELLSHFDYDSTEENSGYLMVLKNGGPLFSLNDKNDLQDKIARNIVITSPSISTDGNVHVGMTVNELLRRFPHLSLSADLEDNVEFFAPSELENGTPENPDAKVLFYVTSNNDKELAVDNQGVYPTQKFSFDGVVRYIRVFKTGMTPPIDSKQRAEK